VIWYGTLAMHPALIFLRFALAFFLGKFKSFCVVFSLFVNYAAF
jgi:hypothetical protein